MAITKVEKIWMDGKLIPWDEAKVHVLSHALHYGTSFFEGIRVYRTPSGPCAFRLEDHLKRLLNSAAIYNCPIPFSLDLLVSACEEVITANQLESAYIRPVAFYGYGGMGVCPGPDVPVSVAIAAFPWGTYLGDDARARGADVCVSSWRRVAPGTIPTGAKAGGNYLSGVLVSSEAKARGFAEGIALDVNGLVSEGAGENLFLVQGSKIVTPPGSASILEGITRDTVIKLAESEGLNIIEQSIPREALYLADEIFMTGTAAEMTPVRSVDGRKVRSAVPGPVTQLLSDKFFGLFDGTTEDKWGWLYPM